MPYFPETYGNVIALKVQRESSAAKSSDFPMARHTVGTLMAPVSPGAREDPREMTAIHVFHEFKGEIGSGEV